MGATQTLGELFLLVLDFVLPLLKKKEFRLKGFVIKEMPPPYPIRPMARVNR